MKKKIQTKKRKYVNQTQLKSPGRKVEDEKKYRKSSEK